MNAYPERPWGWGICVECGQDCDDEADYNEDERASICPECRARNTQPEDEHTEVYVRR